MGNIKGDFMLVGVDVDKGTKEKIVEEVKRAFRRFFVGPRAKMGLVAIYPPEVTGVKGREKVGDVKVEGNTYGVWVKKAVEVFGEVMAVKEAVKRLYAMGEGIFHYEYSYAKKMGEDVDKLFLNALLAHEATAELGGNTNIPVEEKFNYLTPLGIAAMAQAVRKGVVKKTWVEAFLQQFYEGSEQVLQEDIGGKVAIPKGWLGKEEREKLMEVLLNRVDEKVGAEVLNAFDEDGKIVEDEKIFKALVKGIKLKDFVKEVRGSLGKHIVEDFKRAYPENYIAYLLAQVAPKTVMREEEEREVSVDEWAEWIKKTLCSRRGRKPEGVGC